MLETVKDPMKLKKCYEESKGRTAKYKESLLQADLKVPIDLQ